MDKYARKDVKVLVVGNPANTNALVCAKSAPSIPKENFTAMTRLDQNRAQMQIYQLGVHVGIVSNVIIWGNHSSTQYPDASHSVIIKGSREVNAQVDIKDDAWFKDVFLKTVQKRGAVIAARTVIRKSAADHMRDWFMETQPGKFVSMDVMSDGSYCTDKDIVFSFPIEVKKSRIGN